MRAGRKPSAEELQHQRDASRCGQQLSAREAFRGEQHTRIALPFLLSLSLSLSSRTVMKIPFIHLIHLNLYEIGPRVGLILDEQLSLTLNRLQRLSLSLSLSCHRCFPRAPASAHILALSVIFLCFCYRL